MSVGEHYGRRDFGAVILDAVRAAGKDPERLGPEDLAPFEHFHSRGKEATLEMARLAGLEAGTRVLDVGGGFGGPARTLAREIGCPVTVLDLTEAYVRAGEDLTRRSGLHGRVTFRQGDALHMPFADAAFDVGWTQHSSMNIADKPALYREVRRVIRPGGRLAIHEIMAGPNQPIHFPVPWARDAALSHLAAPEEVQALLGALGFRLRHWDDQSKPSLEFFRARAAAAARPAPPPLGLQLVLGDDARPMMANQVTNLAEDRIRIVMAVWERP